VGLSQENSRKRTPLLKHRNTKEPSASTALISREMGGGTSQDSTARAIIGGLLPERGARLF